jgi:hypothetical protein
MSTDARYRALPLVENEISDSPRPTLAVELSTRGIHLVGSSSVTLGKASAEQPSPEDSSQSVVDEETSIRSCCCFRSCFSRCSTKHCHFAIISLFILLFSAGIFIYFACWPVPYTSHILPLTSDSAVFNNTIKVLLVGDSLWGIPQVHPISMHQRRP